MFPEIPQDFAALSAEELQAFIDGSVEAIAAVTSNPSEFVSEEFGNAELLDATRAQVEAVNEARAALATLSAEEAEEAEEEAEETETETVDDDTLAAEMAELAAAVEPAAVEETEPVVEPAAVEEPVVEEPVVAAATPTQPAPVKPIPARRPAPARARTAAPVEASNPAVALVAGAGATDRQLGAEFADEHDLAAAMIRRRSQFGHIAEGTEAKESIARADWSDLYPRERKLGLDEVENQAIIAAATDPAVIKENLKRAVKEGLVASGGLCAPVTPYYNLQMISMADRPVRAALPAFNADRGGIKYARPAALSAVTTAISQITAANDASGGTFATKGVQTIACPTFQETDVEIISHIIQFGNLGARTFPELVAQWNNLVLAAHARTAESFLLTGIDSASTAVTAGDLGLGASAALLGQILVAANGLRNRNRMDPEAVLRLLIPAWAVDMMVSDVIRGQFERFDTDAQRLTALLRTFNVEPTFYLDGATGASQVFGAQGAGALHTYPATCVSYLFPEGSFLYLDGGVLELGLVRDSVLNKTNDFQIFGESFENVAFIGVESIKLTSTVSDTGAVSATHTVTDPVSY